MDNKKIEIDIIEIKEKYKKLSKKYPLPDFKELNEDFDITKSDSDSETLLRDIRKVMMVKISSVLQFVELLLNPSNGSLFHMFLVKGVNESEKTKLDSLFEKLGLIEIDSFELDINYNEKNESLFIKNTHELWETIKPDLSDILLSLKNNWRKVALKKEKSYFG